MTDTIPSPSRRARCGPCGLPSATCLCARAVPLVHTTHVLILQHPDEVGHAKGTGRLLQLSLRRCQLEVGEVFDAALLQRWIGNRRAALLYPAASHALSEAPAVPPDCLVVLDGTWRQSRRMLMANAVLQALPRWSLSDSPPSRYAVRKAHRPGQLSTLEATVLALRRIEGDHPSQQQLLRSFEAHVGALAARAHPQGQA